MNKWKWEINCEEDGFNETSEDYDETYDSRVDCGNAISEQAIMAIRALEGRVTKIEVVNEFGEHYVYEVKRAD